MNEMAKLNISADEAKEPLPLSKSVAASMRPPRYSTERAEMNE